MSTRGDFTRIVRIYMQYIMHSPLFEIADEANDLLEDEATAERYSERNMANQPCVCLTLE